jgi:hypothetical protein
MYTAHNSINSWTQEQVRGPAGSCAGLVLICFSPKSIQNLGVYSGMKNIWSSLQGCSLEEPWDAKHKMTEVSKEGRMAMGLLTICCCIANYSQILNNKHLSSSMVSEGQKSGRDVAGWSGCLVKLESGVSQGYRHLEADRGSGGCFQG